MTTMAWIRVDPKASKAFRREHIRGVDVSLQISPYDLPEAYRGFYDREKGILRIEFKYSDNEPPDRRQLDERIGLELGRFSKKLLAIEIAVDQHLIDVVRLQFSQIGKVLDEADAAIEQLRKEIPRPNARLNYSAVGEILRENRDNLNLIAAG